MLGLPSRRRGSSNGRRSILQTLSLRGGSADQQTAAYAGRASVRLWLKKYPEAASDAEKVTNPSFAYRLQADGTQQATWNGIFNAYSNAPNRSGSVKFTWFQGYYTDSGDPRVAWKADPAFPVLQGALSGYGEVPFLKPLKYTANGDPYRLSGGSEMLLIRAEAALVQGQWPQAMALINSVRTKVISSKTGQPLEPWNATKLEEAWTFLKRERSIELWLEGRRIGDLDRWKANQTPGALDWPDYESLTPYFRQFKTGTTCVPIPESETDVNPNLH